MDNTSVVIDKLTAKLVEDNVPIDTIKNIQVALSSILEKYDVTLKESTAVGLPAKIWDIEHMFIAIKKVSGLSKDSLKQYHRTIADFINKTNKDLKDITPNDIRLYLYLLQAKGNSNCTVDNQRRNLSSFFTWCYNNKYIDNNPFNSVDNIKFSYRERQPLSNVELELMRLACKDIRETVILETLYSTGCRVSELVILKISDINFLTNEVHLFGKGSKHRTSFISDKTKILIEKYLESRTDNDEHLIVSSIKPYKGVSKETIEHIISDIAERAKVPNVYPHRIRHTTATTLLRRGTPIDQVRIILGHESIETTLRYAKTDINMVKESHRKCID